MSTMAPQGPADSGAVAEPHPPLEAHPSVKEAPAGEGLSETRLLRPALPSKIYGVRRAKGGVRCGIFFSLEDFIPGVGCEQVTVEYQVFANLIDAAHYVLEKINITPENIEDDNHHGSSNKEGDSLADPSNSVSSPEQDDHVGEELSAQKKRKTKQPAAGPDSPIVTKKSKTKSKSNPQKIPRYWQAQYDEWRESRDNPSTAAMAKKIAKFEKEQRTEYRYMMQGKKTKMIQDKIDKLQALGFDFQYQELLLEDRQKWESMLEEFKAYQKASDTTSPTKQSPALRDWKHAQRMQFQNLQDGKRSTLTPERIQQLNDAGFIFCPRSNVRTKTWEERIAQLEKYKQENGHLNIPTNHPELGYFTSNIRRAYKYLREGKATGFTEEKAVQLTAMGFQFLVGKRKGPVELKSWDEQFQLLLDFKQKHGHTVVPQHYPGLGRFVKQMRREFKLMKEGKRSTMTPEKVLKLADIGFVFDAQFRRGSKISTNDFTKVGGKKGWDQGG